MSKDDFRALEAMLPQYVNGTLSTADSARIDTALETSSDLRNSLSKERIVQQKIKNGLDNITEESEKNTDTRLEALMEKTKTTPQENNDQNTDTANKNDEKQSSLTAALSILNPRRWHPAMALSLAIALPAQALIIGGQAATIASLEDENFRLASGPCKDENIKGGILLEFVDGSSWQDIANLLDEQELAIFKQGGFGALNVRSKKEGHALTSQIDALRTSPLVNSAEPIG